MTMNRLVQQLRDVLPYDVFTDTETTALVPGSSDVRYGLFKRAVAAKDLIKLRRGVYAFGRRWQRQPLNTFEVAQKLYAPSYISLESALSYHGWIPEAVYTTTSICTHRSVEVETELGLFSFSHLPRFNLIGVDRGTQASAIFLMATPTRALLDYIVVKKVDVTSLDQLFASLRIEQHLKAELDPELITEATAGTRNLRVSTLLRAAIEGGKR